MAKTPTYRYQATETGAVVCDADGSGKNRTYVIREQDMPAHPWDIAAKMNAAYDQGYRQAQLDIRASLGLQ